MLRAAVCRYVKKADRISERSDRGSVVDVEFRHVIAKVEFGCVICAPSAQNGPLDEHKTCNQVVFLYASRNTCANVLH
jgi:hypothetical protein